MKKHSFFIIIVLLFACNLASAQTELWGMTEAGGDSGRGVIFKADANGTNIQALYSFLGGTDGSIPDGGLIQADNGNIYGLTTGGGINGYGILFKYDIALNAYTKLYDFDSANAGNPVASMIKATDGNLYGMTGSGGTFNLGGIFKYDPDSNIYSKLYDFDTTYNNGCEIHGSLCQASNGKLYGMTSYCGLYDYGVIFEFDLSTNTYTKKFDLNSIAYGRYPWGSLYGASNGKLYGTTMEGGTNVSGTVLEYDPATNSVVKLVDFSGANGRNPFGNNLVQASNGKLYGTTSEGGANLSGVLFEVDPATGTFTKKVDLSDTASWPTSSMVESIDGNLYGMTNGDGLTNQGTIFRYNPVSNFVAISGTFQGYNGAGPLDDNHLILVNRTPLNTVWPGDCNNDLTVDNYDFLYLGLAWNDSGAVRPGSSLNWIAQPALPWLNSFPSGVNHKHADANGDGAVNMNDSAGIYLNYGQTHPLRLAQQNTIGDFYLVPDRPAVAPGDTIVFEIHLANSSAPVDSLYGIAFSLLFDQSLLDTTSLLLNYSSSVLGTINNTMRSFEKDFYSSGRIDAALTRIDHSNVATVYGTLGTLTMVASPAISTISTLYVNPSNVRGVSAHGYQVSFIPVQDSVVIDPLFLGLENNSNKNNLVMFPNPASEQLTVQSTSDIIYKVELFDLEGRMVFSEVPMEQKLILSVHQFESGTYTISVHTGHQVLHRKIQIMR